MPGSSHAAMPSSHLACGMRTRCRRCRCMIHRSRLHEDAGSNRRKSCPPEGGTGGLHTPGHNCRKTFRSYGAIPFRVRFEVHGSSLPDYPARRRPFCRRRAEAIGTNHGVLDISTIDASYCWGHAACFLSQVTEGFADEQSATALTRHRASFCFPCRSYLTSDHYCLYDP